MTIRAFLGAAIFDGTALHHGQALVLEGSVVVGVMPPEAVPVGARVAHLDGGTLMPGFVDLQVNGGGGVMFNDETTAEGVAAIAAAMPQRARGASCPRSSPIPRPGRAPLSMRWKRPSRAGCKAFWVCILKGRICRLPAKGPMIRP